MLVTKYITELPAHQSIHMSRLAQYFLQNTRPNQWDLVDVTSNEHNIIHKLDSIPKFRKYAGSYKEEYTVHYGITPVNYTMVLEITEPDNFDMDNRSMDVIMYRVNKNNPLHKRLVHTVYLPEHKGAEKV